MTILSNGNLWKHTEFIENKNFSFDKDKILNLLSKNDIDNAYLSISNWNGYFPTPLIELNKLSKVLSLNKIFYKDESKRFGLKSFKALGGAYAVEKVAEGKKDITVSTATAGNHGRSVAWGARRLGLKGIHMHKTKDGKTLYMAGPDHKTFMKKINSAAS